MVRAGAGDQPRGDPRGAGPPRRSRRRPARPARPGPADADRVQRPGGRRPAPVLRVGAAGRDEADAVGPREPGLRAAAGVAAPVGPPGTRGCRAARRTRSRSCGSRRRPGSSGAGRCRDRPAARDPGSPRTWPATGTGGRRGPAGGARGSTGARWSWRSSRSSSARGSRTTRSPTTSTVNRLPHYVQEGRSRSWLASLVKTARRNQKRYLASRAVGGCGGGQHTDRTCYWDSTHSRRGEGVRLGACCPSWRSARGWRGVRRSAAAARRVVPGDHRGVRAAAHAAGRALDRARPRGEAAGARLRRDRAAAREPPAGATDREGQRRGEAGAGPLVALRPGRIRGPSRPADSRAPARGRPRAEHARAAPAARSPTRRTPSGGGGSGSSSSAATSG